MSTSDFLFQGNPPSSFTNSVESTSTMPDWWQAASQGLISRASQIAAQPYPTYTGPQVAGLDPLQQDAYNKANSYTPQVNNELNSAQKMTQQGGQLFNQGDFNSFMNPYTQNVTNDIATLGNQNLMENVLPQVNDTFTGAGQFGGSRNADFTQRAIRNNQQTISQAQDQALNQGFENSMSNYQTGQANEENAGKNMGALGALTQQQDQGQLGFENALGAQNQTNQQNNLNTAYSNFENQAAYPMTQLNELSGIIHGYQPSASMFQYNTAPLNGTGSQSPLTSIPNILNSAYSSSSNSGS